MTGERSHGQAIRPFVPLSPVANGLTVAVLWAVAVAAGVSAAFEGRPTLVLSYGVFIVYLVVLSAPVVLFATRSGVFHPLVFFVLWRGFVKVFRIDALLASGSLTFHRALPSFNQAALDHVVAKSFLLEILALLGLYAGYSLMSFVRVPRFATVSEVAIRSKVAVWLSMSAGAVLVLAIAAGGFRGLLLQRGIAQEERIRLVVGGHWFLLASVGTVAPILWLAFQPRAVRTIFFWLATLASLAFSFVARGSRSSIVLTIVLLLVVYALRRRRIPYVMLVLGALAGILVLGILGQFRRATQRVDTVGEIVLDSSVTKGFSQGIAVLAQRGTDSSGHLPVIARVPKEVGYLYGRSYLAIPMIVIPRALVGEKPPSGNRLNASLVHDRQNTTIPPGAVAESFWNFSYLGPLIVFFLFGAILKVAAGVFLVNANHPLVIAAYACVLVLFVPSSNGMSDFLQALIAALFFGFFLTLQPLSTRPRLRRLNA